MGETKTVTEGETKLGGEGETKLEWNEFLGETKRRPSMHGLYHVQAHYLGGRDIERYYTKVYVTKKGQVMMMDGTRVRRLHVLSDGIRMHDVNFKQKRWIRDLHSNRVVWYCCPPGRMFGSSPKMVTKSYLKKWYARDPEVNTYMEWVRPEK